MSYISISSLKEQANDVPLIAAVGAQLQSRTVKTTKGGKPYLDLVFADSTGSLGLKVWSDTHLHAEAEKLPLQSIVRLDGDWTQNQWGINGDKISWDLLADEAVADFLAGDPALRVKQEADYAEILQLCGAITDPRLKKLSDHFFETMGDRFRRTAAARKNHHARRGGLVEHVAQMMRSASAVCAVYPELNRDLMLAGVQDDYDVVRADAQDIYLVGYRQPDGRHGPGLGTADPCPASTRSSWCPTPPGARPCSATGRRCAMRWCVTTPRGWRGCATARHRAVLRR
jgi:3'-5' exoribonuclease